MTIISYLCCAELLLKFFNIASTAGKTARRTAITFFHERNNIKLNIKSSRTKRAKPHNIIIL